MACTTFLDRPAAALKLKPLEPESDPVETLEELSRAGVACFGAA